MCFKVNLGWKQWTSQLILLKTKYRFYLVYIYWRWWWQIRQKFMELKALLSIFNSGRMWRDTTDSTATTRISGIWRISLQWRHNELDGVWNQQPRDFLCNRLFGRRSKKTSKLRVSGHRAGNSPVTGEFPARKASNMEMFPFDDVIIYEPRKGIPRRACFTSVTANNILIKKVIARKYRW